MIVAAGPVTAAGLTRAFLTKSKLVTGAVFMSGTLLAAQSIGGPAIQLMQDQFGYLQAIFGSFRG